MSNFDKSHKNVKLPQMLELRINQLFSTFARKPYILTGITKVSHFDRYQKNVKL